MSKKTVENKLKASVYSLRNFNHPWFSTLCAKKCGGGATAAGMQTNKYWHPKLQFQPHTRTYSCHVTNIYSIFIIKHSRLNIFLMAANKLYSCHRQLTSATAVNIVSHIKDSLTYLHYVHAHMFQPLEHIVLEREFLSFCDSLSQEKHDCRPCRG